jgi:carbonic anhydrase
LLFREKLRQFRFFRPEDGFPACGGQEQSPINIKTLQVVYDPRLTPFELINYDFDYVWNITNDGHTGNK